LLTELVRGIGIIDVVPKGRIVQHEIKKKNCAYKLKHTRTHAPTYMIEFYSFLDKLWQPKLFYLGHGAMANMCAMLA
jgi:hypothetical protein